MVKRIKELITRRRKQILVHSVIYYVMDDNIISDDTWLRWARELYDLQQEYPDIAATCPYSEAFAEFHPSTGYDLPIYDPWAVRKAKWLIERRNKYERNR